MLNQLLVSLGREETVDGILDPLCLAEEFCLEDNVCSSLNSENMQCKQSEILITKEPYVSI